MGGNCSHENHLNNLEQLELRGIALVGLNSVVVRHHNHEEFGLVPQGENQIPEDWMKTDLSYTAVEIA